MLNNETKIQELQRELARREHIEFIRYCWVKNKDTSPFITGIHTKKICERIDYVMDQYRKGKSTFSIIQMPPQHGKSDIISRYFPPHFLGEFPEKELVVVSHKAEQAYKFSRFGRNLVRDSKQYKDLYNIKLSQDSKSVQNWEVDNGIGKAQWFGIQTGIAGSGGDCVIVDDYFKKREEADSPVIREKVWNEFTDGIMTRRHDPSINIILATQWDIDDLIGRYVDLMESNKNFPQADIIKFPAESDEYPEKYLFPELYSKEFYESQKILLGDHGWNSLYQQSPTLRGGNLFQVDTIKIIDKDNNKIYNYADSK